MDFSPALAAAGHPPQASAMKPAAGGPPDLPGATASAELTLWARVIRHAWCAGSSLDPDQWFPVSAETGKARQEAAAAIDVCTNCPVRAECLALSLLRWDIGQHGVWGGLVSGERAALSRRRRLAVPQMSTARTAC